MTEILWRKIYDDLKDKIQQGTWPVDTYLPPIAALQTEYKAKSLGTVRQAQQRLVDEGLLVTEHGVGARVISTEVIPQALNVLDELRNARKALDRTIRALEMAESNTSGGPSTGYGHE